MEQLSINNFIAEFPFSDSEIESPWNFTSLIKEYILKYIKSLNDDFQITNNIAIHKTAIIENGAVLKSPGFIGANSFVGANSYLREGFFIADNAHIGANCEIKSSFIGKSSAIAHLNYIGNTIIGNNVNFEAGSIAANHYNERDDKSIFVSYNGQLIKTGVTKFGSLVGDGCKIGANAVLSPGTLILKKTIVKRLELVDQTTEQ
ncbi:LpxA family transferase [Joostella atrarenae]|uniref:LpxA family transferase n=1 Tax=Joostella atrarenae TaxID=679257 RepID=A0ABS9J1B3_9FLAO|nr:DapH/DapD/GlmU-related protein [Joostella atrarenae]MCF8714221.1 LpxA family transferase [Joostella atrarenae]